MRSIRYFGFAQAVCLVLAAGGASEMALQIGSDRQVFVDLFVISKMRGLSLDLHAPVPREVAIAFDRPWEGNTSCLANVMKFSLPGRYRGARDDDVTILLRARRQGTRAPETVRVREADHRADIFAWV